MSKQTEALKLALEALEQIDEAMPFPVAKLAQKVIREALAQPEPSAYWHSEFLKYNTTSDHRMMENAQGELERIKLVQTGVGIGKPEQEPVAWNDENVIAYCLKRGIEAAKHIAPQPKEPEQEPVAWLIWLHGPAGHFDHKQFAEMEFERRNKEYPDPDRKLLPLYTTPPQRKPLTDEEIMNLCASEWASHPIEVARIIEAAHGIKEKRND